MALPSLPTLPSVPTFPAMQNLGQVAIPDIATGSFTGGPSDTVATADIYKIKSSMGPSATPITSIQDLSLVPDSKTLGSIMNGVPATDYLSKLESGAIPSFDKSLALTRVVGTDNSFKAAFNEFNAAMKKGALLSTYTDKLTKMTLNIAGITGVVSTAKAGEVKALGSFLNKYTGKQIFSGKDGGALSSLLGTAITTSSNLGVPGAFKALTDTLNDNGVIGRISRAVLPTVLRNSDSKLLREMTSSPAASLINILSPGFKQNFSKVFQSRSMGASKPLNSFEDIFYSFEKMDSQWDRLSRGGGDNTALNLLSLASGSRDFQSLVMTGVKYWTTEQAKGNKAPVRVDPLYALGMAFPEVTVGQAIHRDFPKVALLSVYNGRLKKTRANGLPVGTTATKKATDARLLTGALSALFGH